MSRTKNATRNAQFGITLKIYQIVMPFVVRTAMIYLMGVQYLGLNSLFTSVLQVLNLAELGVGTAMVYSMYKPIAENDRPTICSLLRLYKIYYRSIGIVLAIIGVALTPFVPKLISGSVPDDMNVYILYLLNLAATVLSYWLFAYKNSLIQAHQRADITSKITIITNTAQYGLQIAVLWIYHNYYLFVIVHLLTQAATNIVTAIIATKMYPDYQPTGKLGEDETKEINKRIRDLFTAKLGTVLGTSVDNVVISAFLGLSMLAIYQNYYYIMNAVVSIILVIFNSCTAGIGNSLVTEPPEKNYNDFRRLSFLTIWICVIGISCFASLYQPFMIIWVGKDLLLPDLMVAFMCFYFFVYVIQMLSCVYKDAAGIWHQDRFRPLIAGAVNFILNVSLVRIWGIYAIVLSTIISYIFIAMPWVIKNLFDLVFKRGAKEYIIEILKGGCLAALSGCICFYLGYVIQISGLAGLVLRFIISFLISNSLVLTLRRRNKMFNPTIDLLDKISRHRFGKLFSVLRYKG